MIFKKNGSSIEDIKGESEKKNNDPKNFPKIKKAAFSFSTSSTYNSLKYTNFQKKEKDKKTNLINTEIKLLSLVKLENKNSSSPVKLQAKNLSIEKRNDNDIINLQNSNKNYDDLLYKDIRNCDLNLDNQNNNIFMFHINKEDDNIDEFKIEKDKELNQEKDKDKDKEEDMKKEIYNTEKNNKYILNKIYIIKNFFSKSSDKLITNRNINRNRNRISSSNKHLRQQSLSNENESYSK
jgi:hypothetical protein